jgi:hypothetical protein
MTVILGMLALARVQYGSKDRVIVERDRESTILLLNHQKRQEVAIFVSNKVRF